MGSRQSRTTQEPFLETNELLLLVEQYRESKYIKPLKIPTSKYKFRSNSSEACPICFENFKENDIMSVNSCYHYWCINCEKKFTTYKCPWCEVDLEPNSFVKTKGKSGLFKKTEHVMNCLNIIKEDQTTKRDQSERERERDQTKSNIEIGSE